MSLTSLDEAKSALEAGIAERKRIIATCKHDKGIIIHKGEEVCARCWICPIPK